MQPSTYLSRWVEYLMEYHQHLYIYHHQFIFPNPYSHIVSLIPVQFQLPIQLAFDPTPAVFSNFPTLYFIAFDPSIANFILCLELALIIDR